MDRQMDGWKDEQTLCYRALPAKTGGPISCNIYRKTFTNTLIEHDKLFVWLSNTN